MCLYWEKFLHGKSCQETAQAAQGSGRVHPTIPGGI